MATKTITIDVEAYRRLKQAKRPTESFSQTIKRIVRPPLDVDAWLKRWKGANLSEDTLQTVEAHVRGRQARSRKRR